MDSSTLQSILIIDDTPSNIEVLSGVLEEGPEILFALDGQEGLEIASNQFPDLILLDILMPGMDGYEVCRRLKAEPRTRNIPVIFITAMDHEEDEAHGLEIGAIDYITKPISPAIVRARVRNHLELKRYRDFLEELSTTDGLTGIPNRRRFDAGLEQEWRRARRSSSPLALIMFDVDYFKAFNDHYGHLAGDDCLRDVARVLASVPRRPADLIARYGGEEFVCLLPQTDEEGARLVAERVRLGVEARAIPHCRSRASGFVTVSAGAVSMMPDSAQLPEVLVQNADARLYQAKEMGRNRVVSR